MESQERPGDFALTDSPEGVSARLSTASLELDRRIDLTGVRRPRLLAWARWHLHGGQRLELVVLPSSGPSRTLPLVAGGRQDRMRRLEADLPPWVGDPAVGLRLRLVSGDGVEDGVVPDDLRVEETPEPDARPLPYPRPSGVQSASRIASATSSTSTPKCLAMSRRRLAMLGSFVTSSRS